MRNQDQKPRSLFFVKTMTRPRSDHLSMVVSPGAAMV
jgi:hypothetical protein